MNITRHTLRLLAAMALLPVLLAVRAFAAKEPVITAVRPDGTNLIVTVRLPDGCRRITLESRPRVGPGAWIPRRAQWTADGAEEITLTLPMTAEMELLRATGETAAELPLPASFYAGRSDFASTVSTSAVPPGAPIMTVDGALGGAPGRDATAEGGGRAVVESDIWQIDGRTMFFFNNARGLQVIDLTTPDSPVLKGTLSFVAQGEQMYLLPGGTPEDRWLALLTSSACDSEQGEIILVRVRDGSPEMAGRIPFEGQIRESRMVGTALYLASYRWHPVPVSPDDPESGVTWKSETAVRSFDLSNPSAPVVRPERVIDATPQAIQATDRYLFVATTGPATGSDDPNLPIWLRPGVNGVTIFDISDPDGSVEQKGSVVVKGRVADKFKMNLREDALAVVSSRDPEWRMVTRTNWYIREFGPNGERLDPPIREMTVYNTFERTTPAQTWLETFNLADPAAPAALGQLKIIENESLFGTRFVGDRAYVVTFRQIDPLWIIDLSNPATPAIRGELQIPGYSSYLEPVGTTRLLAVGVEAGNATVALFDVSNDEKPTQISKVQLGSGWSWSEANSDEKAFKHLPELGLLLVPWQGYENNQYVQAMQLVDFRDDRLTKRGIIHHKLQARRATAVGDRLVSLSGQELLVVDATDRDNPAVKADLDLSFIVNRVRVDGDHLVLLSLTDATIPTVRRVPASAPETVLGSLVLPNFPVVGFEMSGGRLHLMQFEGDTYRQEAVLVTNTETKPPIVYTNWIQVPTPGDIVAREIGFENDQPVLLGESRAQRPEAYYGAFLKGHAAAPGLMLWTENGDSGWSPWGPIDVFFGGGLGVPIAGDALIDPIWGGRGGFWWWGPRAFPVIAVDTATPGSPVIRSTLTLGNTDAHRGFSKAHAADGRLYVSHSEAISREDTKEDGFWWITEMRHMLDVVDFANPAEPLVRPPVPLPGELRGISHRGALLYAAGVTTNAPANKSELWALAYDGVAASLVDTANPEVNASLQVLSDGRVLAGVPSASAEAPAGVDVLRIGAEGRWVKEATLRVPVGYPTLWSVGSMVISESGGGLGFLRPGPDGVSLIGVATPPCGFWGDWAAGDSDAAGAAWLPIYGSRLVRIVPGPGPEGW